MRVPGELRGSCHKMAAFHWQKWDTETGGNVQSARPTSSVFCMKY